MRIARVFIAEKSLAAFIPGACRSMAAKALPSHKAEGEIMSEKVTHIYKAIDEWRTDEVVVIEAAVLKETPKLYWIKHNWPAFETTQIYKEVAHTTRQAALVAYRTMLVGTVRDISQQLSQANDALGRFNAQFKEELS